MVGLDPRANQKVGIETVSGVITDRAIELLGMLNNAIGAEGQVGTQEAEIIFNEGDDTRTEVLSNQLITPSAEDAKWKEDERVYYQATNKKVDLIAEELDANLDRIKGDLVGNITDLFNTLSTKEDENTDGKKSINELELEVANATTTQQLLQAQQALEARATEILTSEEALEAMVNIFFENFNINIERINSEIFDKLHDFDDDYANGASDIENEKYFFQRAINNHLPGEIPGEPKPAIILNSTEEILNHLINNQRLVHEDIYGAGTYTNEMADQYISNTVGDKFFSGELKLSDDIIALIIEDRGLTDEDLEGISDMKDFLDMISFNQLIEYTGIADRKAAIESLYKDHLQIFTPKYYEDQRTIFDILNGKNNDVNSGNTKDRVFSSVDSQMKNVAQGIDDLMRNGYDKVGTSNLQIAIRQNPFAGMEYLEAQKTDPNLDSYQKELIEEQIDVLTIRQVTHLKNLSEALVHERREIRLSENVDEARIEEINTLIDKAVEAELQLRNYDPADNADTRTKLAALFPNASEINFDGSLEYKTFTNAMDPEAKYTRASKVLFTMEDQESSKKNAEYFTKKRPTPQADGTIPEDTAPIPPLLSPSPLSAVIAKIGDTVIEKSQALINGDEIPTTDWMVDHTSTLIDINEKLGDLGATTAGEAFLDNLRESFKDVIKDFFATNSGKKDAQDAIRTELESTVERQQELTALNGDGFDLGTQTLGVNLNNIENGLNGNIKSGANFVNKAGLEQTQAYLAQNIDALDDVNYAQETTNATNEIGLINDKITAGTATAEDLARLAVLNAYVVQLGRDANNLDKAQDLLYGVGGTQTNPRTGSVLSTFNNFNDSVDQLIADNGGLAEGQTRKEFMDGLEGNQATQYKTAVQDYSDSLTDFGKNDNAIVDTFKESLDKTSLDLDENGVNDFVDIKNMVTSLTGLSETITNTFGGMEAKEGGVDAQSIRRLILLMFVFSMLEAGEWDTRLNDASTDRYALT